MTKSDLIVKISENLKCKKNDVSMVIEEFISMIQESLKNGEEVKLTGFGSFETRNKPAREARNPKTGEKVMTEEKMVIKFKASGSFKNKLNN